MLFGEFAKSQAEAEYPELWRGLVGAWSPCLSPRGGTVLRDLSGRGNHGTLTNMDPETDWVTRGGKQALDFDGSNDIVIASARSAQASVESGIWTLSTWIYSRGSGVHHATSIGTSGTGFLLHFDNGQKIQTNANGNTEGGKVFQSTNSCITRNVWMHLVYRMDANGMRYWANGVEQGITMFTGTNGPVTYTVGTLLTTSIGAGWVSNAVNTPHSMIYGESLWHGRALDPVEIALLYRLGPGGWATPRRRRWNYVTAQTAIPYWVFGRKNARLIGGGVT